MTQSLLHSEWKSQEPTDLNDIPQLVDVILAAARSVEATDVHLRPMAIGMEMCWRIDGVLQSVTEFPAETGPKIIARLKVLSGLLTYRTETPQEGRIPGHQEELETRLSVYPTLFGEKAVIRLFAGAKQFHYLDDLGLPSDILSPLKQQLEETSGVVLLTGPAGSGKTTTIYAALREILNKSQGGRSLVTIEDPIEVAVPGVDQSQVNLPAGFEMEAGVKALLRQDPDVIMVGEIRDRATAETVFQASLTGHLVITTFHAGSSAQAVRRLAEMGIEPYLLRSGLLAILCQRLVRTLCVCAKDNTDAVDKMGLEVERVRLPVGCDACQGTGYQGRMVLTEMLQPDHPNISEHLLKQSDAKALDRVARESGMVTQWERALHAITEGRTSPGEVFRVLGALQRNNRGLES